MGVEPCASALRYPPAGPPAAYRIQPRQQGAKSREISAKGRADKRLPKAKGLTGTVILG
jgi:hypothetical protein